MRKVTPMEAESFDWFVGRSAFKLPGLFVPRFWKPTLIQASTSEPAVLNAVLALSTIHKSETIDDRYTNRHMLANLGQFMLLHYGKAMKQLQPDISTSDQSTIRVTIISCVVFVYIEFLRGRIQAGLTHLHYGLKLIQELPSPNHDSRLIDADHDVPLLDWAIEPLLRLYLQAMLLGQLSEPLHPAYSGVAYIDLPTAFASPLQSRCYLDLLLARVLYLFNSPPLNNPPQPLTKTVRHYSEAQRIQLQLRIWLSASNATMANVGKRATLRDRITYTSQLNFCAMATIMAAYLTRPSEMTYDAYTPGFLAMLERSIGLYKMSHVPGLKSAVLGIKAEFKSEPVIDIGWLPGLYFIAVRCRVPRIRHHAIALIRSSVHKEGMWHAELTACIAAEVARVEEIVFYSHVKLQSDFELTDLPDIGELREPTLPEWCRIQDLRVRLPGDPTGSATLTYRRNMSEHGALVVEHRVYDLRGKQWTTGLD
ncbi:uncharacterized protein HMPREF1541_03701 [Cyphellophora europaea CBS 101466]|uniref:Transcription factor domain-containing protein n=1 Tax=Cyphellophora europaea (strain CBS 101466) TaxID=1220924 RepID=W2S1B7_CYPE1|nr:uncharacterized protein HMPREF1541_03701 [Cyphellophora europaea CBS 101466]ETN41764.1 hypothetical protein HMPREF1541_03701 [Cyphellophora europaea CBS 101466]